MEILYLQICENVRVIMKSQNQKICYAQTYIKLVNKWQGALHQSVHKVFLCLYDVLEAIPSFIWNAPELNRACLYCLCLTSQKFILTLFSQICCRCLWTRASILSPGSSKLLTLYQGGTYTCSSFLLCSTFHKGKTWESGQGRNCSVHSEQVPNVNAPRDCHDSVFPTR